MNMNVMLVSFLFSDLPHSQPFSQGKDGICHCTFKAAFFFSLACLINNDEASATLTFVAAGCFYL